MIFKQKGANMFYDSSLCDSTLLRLKNADLSSCVPQSHSDPIGQLVEVILWAELYEKSSQHYPCLSSALDALPINCSVQHYNIN